MFEIIFNQDFSEKEEKFVSDFSRTYICGKLRDAKNVIRVIYKSTNTKYPK